MGAVKVSMQEQLYPDTAVAITITGHVTHTGPEKKRFPLHIQIRESLVTVCGLNFVKVKAEHNAAQDSCQTENPLNGNSDPLTL